MQYQTLVFVHVDSVSGFRSMECLRTHVFHRAATELGAKGHELFGRTRRAQREHSESEHGARPDEVDQ